MHDANRLFVSLLGPPNVGKSTLAGALTTFLDAYAIRPREAIKQTVTEQPYIADLFAPVDDLGWASDYALAYAVRVTIHALPPTIRRVVLENLPWDTLQLLDLQHLVSRTSSELVVLFIDASDDVLIQRANRRRVCQTCERDSMNEPRKPALGAMDNPEQCSVCSSRLVIRPDDSPEILARRIERSREYLARMLRHADDTHIPVYRLNGEQPADVVRQAAFEVLNQCCDLGA